MRAILQHLGRALFPVAGFLCSSAGDFAAPGESSLAGSTSLLRHLRPAVHTDVARRLTQLVLAGVSGGDAAHALEAAEEDVTGEPHAQPVLLQMYLAAKGGDDGGGDCLVIWVTLFG